MSYLDIGKRLLAAIPSVVAAAPAFKEVWDDFVSLAKPADQPVLQQRYADLIAENDAGFQRLDDKLAEAEKRP
jgi:hypothetical protein